MMLRVLSYCTVLTLMIAMLTACAESAPAPTPEPTAQPTTQPAEAAESTTQPAAAGELIPYPLDVCLVSDEALDSMGGAYVIAYEGREIKFCCSGCEGMFKKNPAKYLAKLAPAAEKASAIDTADVTLAAVAAGACCSSHCDACCGDACATCCADGCEKNCDDCCGTAPTAACCCVDTTTAA
jgi:YHS domain-containing protein